MIRCNNCGETLVLEQGGKACQEHKELGCESAVWFCGACLLRILKNAGYEIKKQDLPSLDIVISAENRFTTVIGMRTIFVRSVGQTRLSIISLKTKEARNIERRLNDSV